VSTHRCRDCGETKPLSEFYLDKKGRPASYCKPCLYVRTQASRDKYRPVINERERARYAADHNGRRSKKLDRRRLLDHGVTREQYDALLDRQGGVCAICVRPFGPALWTSHEAPVIDHNHETGAIRGVLHRRCNLALEYLLSDADLERARAYLSEGVDNVRRTA
jgi:hypothetical protein